MKLDNNNVVPPKAFIDGLWMDSEIGKTFPVTNPANGEVIAEVPDCGKKYTEIAIGCAKDALKSWKNTTARERAQLLLKVKDLLEGNLEEVAALITLENGKPLKEARMEVKFSASFFEWYAGEGKRAYGETIPSTAPGKTHSTIRKPLGVAALITPWNFPLGMLARKLSAALAAGCTAVIKPSEETPLSALYMAKVCNSAGIPKGVVNVVPCSRDKVVEVGEQLCSSPHVSVVSFTGSTATGKWLYEKCASTMKKIHMELGGNAPFIVFDDANIEEAVNGLMNTKFRNAGQTCISANRIYVQESIMEEFTKLLVEKVKNLRVGPGDSDETDMGPMISEKQIQRLENMVNEDVKKGAKVIEGGSRISKDPKCNFYQPTVILGNELNCQNLHHEEIFGPVAVLLPFEDVHDVVPRANATDKGLAAYVFTKSLERSTWMADCLEYGMVGINEPFVSTVEAPFGGTKMSGFGIEGSKHGLDEYTYLKHVSVKVSPIPSFEDED